MIVYLKFRSVIINKLKPQMSNENTHISTIISEIGDIPPAERSYKDFWRK